MNKTLRKKLTEKHLIAHTTMLLGHNGDAGADSASLLPLTGFGNEMQILREAAKDLLQPRPEAIERLLKMAKES